MPGLRSLCRLRRFQDFHLRTLGFVVPTQSIDPRTCLRHDSHEHCCVPSTCVGLALSLDTSPCCDAMMLFCASDECQRFSPDCVHQEIVQLFRTELHLWSELCKRFLRQSSECTFHRWFEIRHGCHRLQDAGPFALRCRVLRRLERLFITRGSTCPVDVIDSCSLGFRCQSLSFSELLAHFCQCLGQLLHRCHI